jgi:hypothetical protein
MRSSKILLTAAAAALACGVLLPTASAYADDVPDDGVVQTAPPATPEEPNLIEPTDPAAEPTPDPAMNHPGSEYCDWYGGYYSVSSRLGNYHWGVGGTQSNYNGTSHNMTSTFTSTTTGTVGVSLSASTEVSLNALVAKQKATLGIDLSTSRSITTSNSVTATAAPYKTINAKYGVWRVKITGQTWRVYSNCGQTAKRTVTSYTPWKTGWYVWES